MHDTSILTSWRTKVPSELHTLDSAAIAAHEMFMAYVRAGFTRDEALRFTIAVVTSTLATKPEDGK